MLAIRVVVLLISGLAFLGMFTNPLVDTLMKFFSDDEASIHHTQFYISCFILPFITNSYNVYVSLNEAQHRQRKTISLMYGWCLLRLRLLPPCN
jgi:hypothetical protein